MVSVSAATGQTAFYRGDAEKMSVDSPITVQHTSSCELSVDVALDTTANDKVTVKGRLLVQKAGGELFDVVASLQSIMKPPSLPPATPPP